uniref:Uncharacterized protein n=1 Tax=Amphimedon queenslandica TaxID=400682 RepID=A0A1X7T2T3_AMPQE
YCHMICSQNLHLSYLMAINHQLFWGCNIMLQ